MTSSRSRIHNDLEIKKITDEQAKELMKYGGCVLEESEILDRDELNVLDTAILRLFIDVELAQEQAPVVRKR